MKQVLILLFIAFSFKVSAQLPWTTPKGKIKSITPFWRPLKKDSLLPILNLIIRKGPQAKLSHSLPNGDKIYLLPLDNMPCIVPDMSQFNMPTGTVINDSIQMLPKPGPGKIPNPITPYRIIPENGKK